LQAAKHGMYQNLTEKHWFCGETCQELSIIFEADGLLEHWMMQAEALVLWKGFRAMFLRFAGPEKQNQVI